MFLSLRTRKPRKLKRNASARYTAKLKAKNRRRRARIAS
jgi:hypothetical protein